MRKSIAIATLLGCAAVFGGTAPRAALADSFSMAAGMQSEPGPVCYSWGIIDGNVGLYKHDENPDCFNQTFVMPLYWRNFYSASTTRTVTVRGRRPSSSSLIGCTLSVYNSNGVLVSSNSASFAVTGTNYGSISLAVNNVLSTSSSFISCQSVGNSYLMKVDFSP